LNYTSESFEFIKFKELGFGKPSRGKKTVEDKNSSNGTQEIQKTKRE